MIGNLTAVNPDGFKEVPTGSACGLFVDHLIGVPQPTRSGFGTAAGSQGQAKSQGNSKSQGKTASSAK